MNVQIIKQDELPFSTLAHEFIRADHEGVGASIIFVDAEPGRGPRLHKHPYEEILIILEGSARLVVGDRQLSAGEGEIVIVPRRPRIRSRAQAPGRYARSIST
jgi:mannose-6-phosphate isomerase-like protein (cupin superfamily)